MYSFQSLHLRTFAIPTIYHEKLMEVFRIQNDDLFNRIKFSPENNKKIIRKNDELFVLKASMRAKQYTNHH